MLSAFYRVKISGQADSVPISERVCECRRHSAVHLKEIFMGNLTEWRGRSALCLLGVLVLSCFRAEARFEAESVLENPEILQKEKFVKDQWTLWSTDVDAAKKWSGGVVIRGNGVTQDRVPGEGSPILTFHISLPEKGRFDIYAKVQRSVAVSTDGGKTWRRFSGGFVARDVPGSRTPYRLQIADAYVNPGNAGPCYIDFFEVRPGEHAQAMANRKIEIENGNFEQSAGGRFPGWSKLWTRNPKAASRIEASAEKPHSGKYAARFQMTDAADWSWNNVRFAVEPGEEFVYGGFARKLSGKAGEVALQFVGYRDGRLVSYETSSLELASMNSEWKKYEKTFVVPYNVNQLQFRVVGEGTGVFELDDLYVRLIGRKEVKIPVLPKPRLKYEPVTGFSNRRIEEKLDRGLVAMRTRDGVYLSWRLLKDDSSSGFDLFRVADGRETKVNAVPIRQTCDYLDTEPGNAAEYVVRPSDGGHGVIGRAETREKTQGNPHLTFTLGDPRGRVDKVGIGDLDGDGKYDLVARIASGSVDPWHVVWKPSPDTLKLEAFSQDGKRLWSFDQGWSIERGIWYSPFLVYDLNGDGKAEVALKQGEGDPRDADGRVTGGKEYLMILDGMTGKKIAEVPWPDREGFTGRSAYNHASRNQLAVAYLDGKTPAIIALRGTYATMKAEAWQLNGRKLELLWKYDSRAYGREYQGQGAHTTRIADLDGDGRDEIILGSAVLDDDGRPLWTTGLGHPDYLYVTNVTNKNPGMEIITVLETATPKGGGIHVADAKTGKTVWKLGEPANHVHHGYGADLDPRYRGLEVGGVDTDSSFERRRLKRWFFNGDGELLFRDAAVPEQKAIRTVFWDADLQREIVSAIPRDFLGGPSGGVTEGSFLMAADIFGDWREEIFTAVKGEVRIYSTDIPAMDRRVTLMQDPQYRLAVATSSMGYLFDSCLSYLPTDVSPNLNLTLSPKGMTRSLRVVISAPLDRPLRGTLTLSLPSCFDCRPEKRNIDLAKGGLETLNISMKIVGELQGKIRAELVLDDGTVLRGQVAVRETPVKVNVRPPEGFVVEAEDFIAEKGGKVLVRSDKAGVSKGKSFSHWDKTGHELTWKIHVPEDGKYKLQLRYCGEPTTRTIRVNDEMLGVFHIPTSGGFGTGAGDWETYTVERQGKALPLTLKAGLQTIRIVNTRGEMMNLDYLALVPVK